MQINGKEYKTWKLILSFGSILGILTSLFVLEDRWNQQPGLLAAEQSTVKTFEVFQIQQKVVTKTLQLQLLNIQYDNLSERYFRLQKELRDNPTDPFLLEEFARVKVQRKKIDEARDCLFKD